MQNIIKRSWDSLFMEEIICEEFCVVCGAPVPEGRMICASCENGLINKESGKQNNVEENTEELEDKD